MTLPLSTRTSTRESKAAAETAMLLPQFQGLILITAKASLGPPATIWLSSNTRRQCIHTCRPAQYRNYRNCLTRLICNTPTTMGCLPTSITMKGITTPMR